MTRFGIPLLAILAVLLSTLLWRELSVGPDAVASPAAFSVESRPSSGPVARWPEESGAKPAVDDAAVRKVLLARPLFEPGRRPPVTAQAAVAAAPVVVPRVTGVLVTGTERSAIFAVPGESRSQVAGEGGRVGAFTVLSIAAGQVTLLGPTGTLVLRPAFGARGTPAQDAPPQTPPRTAPPPGLAGLPGLPAGAVGRFGLPTLPGLPVLPGSATVPVPGSDRIPLPAGQEAPR
jgi:hypothetical protein